jgi:hypothetical protein
MPVRSNGLVSKRMGSRERVEEEALSQHKEKELHMHG